MPAPFLDLVDDFTRLGLAAAITAVVAFHQAAVEVFKLLSKSKARNYYDALAYIVYGPSDEPFVASAKRVLASLVSKPALVPLRVQVDLRQQTLSRIPASGPGELAAPTAELSADAAPSQAISERSPDTTVGQSSDWVDGIEGRLIESFLLRSVGDDPVAEISDRDVENVANVARLGAPADVRRTIEWLDSLIARGTTDPAAAADALAKIPAGPELKKEIQAWVRALRSKQPPRAVGALLEAWRAEFVERHLPAEVRARMELGNAFRAAEYRYHRVVHRFSFALAAVEAGLIAWGLTANGGASAWVTALAGGALAFGVLSVAPPAGKSLLDAVMGLGKRLG